MLNITKYSMEYLNITSDDNLFNFTESTPDNSTELHGVSTSTRTTSNSAIANLYSVIVTAMISSIICLILSIRIYCILPEFKNVHGKNLISLSSCLLTTYILLCLDIVLRLHISYSFCFAIAFVIHVTFLATFFWTNVMAFDIWNNMTSMKAKSEVKSTSRKHAKYSVYAWSGTALTALPAVVFESTNLISEQYRPQFGVKRCWLSGRTAFTYYFNLPVGVILLGNLILFSLTIRRLWLIKKTTAILQMKQQKNRFNLYLKLFLVMGIIWFSEFLPWITGIYQLYAAAGLLTAMHGDFLFIIFILRKRVLRQLKERRMGKSASQMHSTSQPSSSNCILHSTSQFYTESKI